MITNTRYLNYFIDMHGEYVHGAPCWGDVDADWGDHIVHGVTIDTHTGQIVGSTTGDVMIVMARKAVLDEARKTL